MVGRKHFLPYNQPEVGDDEVRAVTEVLLSRWLTRGAVTQAFEAALAQYLGVSEVVAVSSGTAALHLALMSVGAGPGDEVITTPMTFAASVNAIIQTGATPVLVDIDPDTGNIDLDAAERALTERTRAILPVHYGGCPVDIRRLNRLRDGRNVRIVEDAAHALAARHDGALVGAHGNLTAFSFYATKNLTTGEGGALAVPTADAAGAIRAMALHGLSRHAWNRYQRGGSWEYDVIMLGYKYNMTDVQAAMGLAQLDKLSAMQQKRAELADRYRTRLQGLPLRVPQEPDGVQHAWHLYSVHLDLDAIRGDRADVIEDLAKANIGTSVHFIPIYRHTFYREKFGWQNKDFPATEAFFAGQISLPLYPSMSTQDVDDVASALTDSLKRRRT